MRIGKREPRARVATGRTHSAFRPSAEGLEDRQLLTGFNVDLVNVAGTTNAGPFGVLEVGTNDQGSTGVGYSSAVVGDVNGDGFDDFLFGGPSIQANTAGPVLDGTSGIVYLIFGSNRSDNTSFNWRNLITQERVGGLDQLGNASQVNPINNSPGFPFNGLRFVASQNPNNLLGASVAAVGDINGDGLADFAIGAPGALDATGTAPNTGRAYLVYGNRLMSAETVKNIDFDNDVSTDSVQFTTFVNDPIRVGSLTGFSVGAVSSFLTAPATDLAIGAPLASIGAQNSGAVYVIARSALTLPRTINLSTVGQGGSNNTLGVVFVGANIGDQAGASVNGAGNVDGDRNQAGIGLGDLLIGATQSTTGTGQAYLIYGATNMLDQGLTVGGITAISLARVVSTTNNIPGAVFVGDSTGDQTGFSVSTAGDFNGDQLSDFAIGSPFWNGPAGIDSGRANLIFGRSVNSSAGRILGTFILSNMPAAVPQIQFNGPAINAQAGFSISAVGNINSDGFNEFLIGAPGTLNGSGIVYLIPGNPDITGTFSLATAIANGLEATVITNSSPLSSGPNYLGASVSGLIGVNAANQTVDADSVADFTIGSAGFNFQAANVLAGAGFLLEGFFVPLALPVSNNITSPIAVEEFPSASVINPVTPDELQLFILSAGANVAGFEPFDFIDPDTILVNGVASAEDIQWTNAGDLDGDGIDDATFTFSPRSSLGLPQNSNLTITITARTLATAPAPFTNRRYTGEIGVRTTGGVTPPAPAGLPLSFGPQFRNRNLAAPRYGERFLPQLQVINRPRWAPLSTRLAYRQFVPQGNFGFRLRNYFHPPDQKHRRTRTLAENVFTRGRFPKGVHIGAVKYNQPVIGNGQKHIFPK